MAIRYECGSGNEERKMQTKKRQKKEIKALKKRESSRGEEERPE